MRESYIEVNSQLLTAACKFGLELIKEVRELAVVSAIDNLMNKKFFRPKSREAALLDLKVTMYFTSEYEKLMSIDIESESLLTDLLGMSKLSNKVYLSKSDYQDIKYYIG